MSVSPCIVNSNCIDLSIDADSNLRADLVISPAANNCASCTADGLFVDCASVSADACNAIAAHADGIWALQPLAGYHAIGPSDGASYQDLTVAGPLLPAGNVVARTGTFSFTAPTSCASGLLVLSQLIGPVQATDVSAGGRVITGFQSRFVPDPYAGGPYTVLKNSGAALGEHAWPTPNPTPIITTITSGTAYTIEWQQTYEVTAGSVGSLIFRAIYMYALLLFIS